MKKLLTIILVVLQIGMARAQIMAWRTPMQQKNDPYVCGRAWNTEIGDAYFRMPQRMEKQLPKAVWSLSHNSAGLYVKFKTDSKKISVRYLLSNQTRYAVNMTPYNHSGIDLYVKVDGKNHWIPNQSKTRLTMTKGDTARFNFIDLNTAVFPSGMGEYTLYLPTYNSIKGLEIGVEPNATFSFIRESMEKKPIVIYGTSIAHGASASRPGMIWTNILQRELNYPIINLGFSGSALCESSVFDALCEIDERIYIIDAVPNCHGLNDSTFNARLRDGIKKLRNHTSAPIILAESNALPKPAYAKCRDDGMFRIDLKQQEIYKNLRKKGVKGLYYISRKDFGFTEDDYIEGVHPNDLGMRKYADAYKKLLIKLLKKKQ